jgi:branched-chain amino acid transport system permease protein
MYDYLLHIAVLCGIYVILSISLNLAVGFTGLFNIGHAAFYGIGAYTSALLTLAGVPWWIALIASAIMAGLFGFMVGVPCLRLRGDYLAIATLGFGEIIRAVMKNWTGLTRGPLGLPGIPKPSLFGVQFASIDMYLLLVVVIAIITVVIVNRLVKSPFGRVLKSIREDEIAAKSLGKNVVKYKLQALALSAMFAGVAGSLYAHYITFIDPSTFTLMETVLMLCMVVLGGSGSIIGSVVGAIILVVLPEPLRFISLPSSAAAALRQMIYSVSLILMMIFRPQGIFGETSTTKKFDLRKLLGMRSPKTKMRTKKNA